MPSASRARDARTPVLFALMVTMTLVAMDATIVATALPQVVGDLGGFSLVGWVLSVYLLAQTVTIPVYGKLSDLFGRKPVLLAGVVMFLVGSAACAASWNMLSLIIFRSLQGIGAGSIGATVNTIAGDLYDVKERGRIQGWLSSVWGVSAVVAPTVGGIFAQYASWRWIFLVNLPLGIFALVLLTSRLHERVERRQHRIDYAGAASVLACAGLMIFGLLQGGTAWGWTSPQSMAVFVLSAVAGAVTIQIERRAAEPILPPWLWRRRAIAGSYAATLAAGLVVIGLSTFMPIWAQAVLGVPALVAGLILGVMGFTWPLASSFSSRLYLRIGFRDTAAVGAGLAIAAGIVFTLMPASASIWLPVLGTALMGAGLGLITTSLIVGLQSTVGWSERGVITGGVSFSRFLGRSLGAAIFGAVTNAVILHKLRDAPADLLATLPKSVDGVSRALTGGHANDPAAEYLRASLHASAHVVYIGLLAAAIVTFILLVAFVPRRFSTRPLPPSEHSSRTGRAPFEDLATPPQ